MNHKIILTGGGTAGHVTPNLALIELLKEKNWQVEYIGSENGVEARLVKPIDVPYHSIKSGKLRRYFSLENFIDPFKIAYGVIQSFFIIRKIKPHLVFSKGGFVSFPVVVGAWLNRVPIIVHESDLTPGLANRLSFPFANKICLTFESASKHIEYANKTITTGTPIRQELFSGDAEQARKICGFQKDKPCILVIGGSLGANSINLTIRHGLKELLKQFQVIHICGQGKIDESLQTITGYCQFEYVTDVLPDLFALASVVVSRSGANSLYEILALQKPHVLIPLSKKMSRGDQIENARHFKNLGVSTVLDDDALETNQLIQAIQEVFQNKTSIINQLSHLNIKPNNRNFLELFSSEIKQKGQQAKAET